MPFGKSLDEIIGKVKQQVDQFSNSQHQQQPQHPNQFPGAVQHPQQPPHQQPIPGPFPSSYWRASFDPSALVSAQFKQQQGDWGWGNNELQNYTTNPANSFYRGDHKLILRAIANANGAEHQKYTSARLTSLQTLGRQRGCLEVVLTPPVARGIWPAFWLLPAEPFQWPNEGEVDICESWNAEPVNHSCLHWGFFTAEDATKHRALETNISDLGRPGGHSFAFAWDQPNPGHGGRMVWYIDGRAVMKEAIPDGLRPMANWQIIINVAMGGNVCQGVVPADGAYDFIIHSLQLVEQPAGGWEQFNNDFNATVEGHTN